MPHATYSMFRCRECDPLPGRTARPPLSSGQAVAGGGLHMRAVRIGLDALMLGVLYLAGWVLFPLLILIGALLLFGYAVIAEALHLPLRPSGEIESRVGRC